MDFFKINGKKIKPPTELTVSPEILDIAERTVDGTMVVNIIGTKRKVDVSWEYLSKEDMVILSNAVKSSIFADVSFHDSMGSLVTMTARAENLTFQPHYNWAKGQLMWKGVSVSFTER